ncbi:MAG: cytochrome c biogenesis protein CcdA [Promethearchaeota archaeon]
MTTVSLLEVFLFGLSVGIAPCILLMLSAFGTSLILIEEKGKFIRISIGLITGILLTYLIISIIFIYFTILMENLYIFLKYIFAGILIVIGIWQILECRKEKSRIFGTPEKIKLVLKDFIERNSGFYAFLVGIIFVLIKFPCSAPIYGYLLVNLIANPLLYVYIMVYLIGVILPTILILILFRLGLESSKFNDFRLKYRTHLRFFSGALLIFLSIYLLIF